jgi:hypothetical protein
VPRDAVNLLVPVAVSSSHVGFCALRLEPIWMSLGQAAGHAAHLALQGNVPVQQVPVPALQDLLHADRAATIYASDVPPDAPQFRAVQWFGTRGAFHGLVPLQGDCGERGPNIIGQYYQAFPGHAIELNKPVDAALLKRWIALLPKEVQQKATEETKADGRLTRGEALVRLLALRE